MMGRHGNGVGGRFWILLNSCFVRVYTAKMVRGYRKQ